MKILSRVLFFQIGNQKEVQSTNLVPIELQNPCVVYKILKFDLVDSELINMCWNLKGLCKR
jgi:hypothetical protein